MLLLLLLVLVGQKGSLQKSVEVSSSAGGGCIGCWVDHCGVMCGNTEDDDDANASADAEDEISLGRQTGSFLRDSSLAK